MSKVVLITSNIRFANPTDGEHDWDQRKSLLAGIIQSHQPQVLATQEGRGPQVKDLALLLTDYKLVDAHRQWIAERMYPCLFVKKECEVVASGDIWLSLTPDIAGSADFESQFPRLCTWIKTKLNGETWLVVSTHLDHVLGATRTKQIEVLVCEVSKIRGVNDRLVVMGDFNDSPESITRQTLMNGFPHLVDPWGKNPEESSHHGFNGVCPEGHRIDWILIENPPQNVRMYMDKTSKDGRWPSDHFPIVCELNF